MELNDDTPDQKQLTKAIKCPMIQDFKSLLRYLILNSLFLILLRRKVLGGNTGKI